MEPFTLTAAFFFSVVARPPSFPSATACGFFFVRFIVRRTIDGNLSGCQVLRFCWLFQEGFRRLVCEIESLEAEIVEI